jgi:dipeptidase E
MVSSTRNSKPTLLPRLILAGGGSETDSALLDRIFAAWTGRGGRMLYLPVALDPEQSSYDHALRWVRSVFEPLGARDITMWGDLAGHSGEELESFDSVYIGGGNTFRLLSLLKVSSFDRHVADYFHAGGAIYGGSAGAIVMGRNIYTASHLDPNDLALTDTRGLGLAGRYSIWCHYTPEDDPLIFGYIRRYRFPVLALSERSGVIVEGERMTASGYEPVLRFTARRKHTVPPGEQV